MNGFAGQLGQRLDPYGFDDFGVTTHNGVMQYALPKYKRLLRNSFNYSQGMDTPADRLRHARVRAGYNTGKEAAEALGFPVSTYLGHENGSRGFPAKKAAIYARRYKVTEEWLLYGKGDAPGETDDPKAEVVRLFRQLPPIKKAEAIGYLRGLAEVQK